jgi:hypothetical protein
MANSLPRDMKGTGFNGSVDSLSLFEVCFSNITTQLRVLIGFQISPHVVQTQTINPAQSITHNELPIPSYLVCV